MSRLIPYSRRTFDLLANPPEPGQGRHVWLFRVASGLLRTFEPDFVKRSLVSLADRLGWTDRDFAAEIHAAVEKVERGVEPHTSCVWPEPDHAERRRRFTTPPLFRPVSTGLTAAQVLPRLFNPGELVCFAPDPFHAATWPMEAVLPEAANMAYIVANAMRVPTGRTALGRESARCMDNACTPQTRRYVVVEFDQGESLDAQTAVLSSLHSPAAPLVLAVFSGGKSIHGWYAVEQLTPALKQRFFDLAVYLGADRSLWDRSKLVRMPGGRRENGASQDIFYFNKEETP